MDKDKPQGGGGGRGLPPHSPHHGSLASPPSAAPGCGVAERGCFSQDISRMPENPPRSTGHRRAQSEILGLPDDLAFDSDLGIVGQPGDGPSLSDETEEDVFSMYIDMDKFGASGPGLPDAEASMSATTARSTASAIGSESLNLGSNERVRVRHQHSQSMDGSTSIKLEMLASSSEGPSLAEAKKAMSAAKLAELALVDPKRAKRIWANRQSAARSKERKMRYIAELERRVQALQTEATTLSAQLTVLQRDTTNLTAENSELKLHLQAMEQQNNLQEALNDALREEIQRLRVATGLAVPNGGQMNSGASTFGANQQYYHHNYAMQSLLAAQHLQQLQICTRQQQQQVHPNKHQVQQEQQPPSDQKMKEAMTPETQKESTSDSNSTSNE